MQVAQFEVVTNTWANIDRLRNELIDGLIPSSLHTEYHPCLQGTPFANVDDTAMVTLRAFRVCMQLSLEEVNVIHLLIPETAVCRSIIRVAIR